MALLKPVTRAADRLPKRMAGRCAAHVHVGVSWKSLDHVNDLVVKEVIKKDIVVMLDCSDLVWPSLWSCRSFFPVLQERLPAPELRERTQAFAIVQRESFWMRSVVDTVLLMTQPETIPIFAKAVAEPQWFDVAAWWCNDGTEDLVVTVGRSLLGDHMVVSQNRGPQK
eukprot:Skav209031  [mRNA]  locus=scaffold1809:48199:50381:- [translate_table: standard]